MNKDIAIYSFNVSNSLLRQGYKLKNMKPNSEIPGKIVFYFENTKDIRRVLREIHGIIIEDV